MKTIKYCLIFFIIACFGCASASQQKQIKKSNKITNPIELENKVNLALLDAQPKKNTALHKTIEDVFWDKLNEEIIIDAQKNNKCLVILFEAPGRCEACSLFRNTTLSDEKIKNIIDNNFITSSVDVDKDSMSAVFNINTIPALLFINGDGRMLLKTEGLIYNTDMEIILNKVLEYC